MKRSIFIVCLLILSLVARGVEHHFNEGAIASFLINYTKAITTDGTIYTCTGNAAFTNATIGGKDYGIYLKIPQNSAVIVSPAKQGLNEIIIHHISNTVSMQVSVSTDSISWTPVAGTQNTKNVTVEGLSGNYYVKMTNTYGSNTDIQVTEMEYYMTTCPNCFTVVAP